MDTEHIFQVLHVFKISFFNDKNWKQPHERQQQLACIVQHDIIDSTREEKRAINMLKTDPDDVRHAIHGLSLKPFYCVTHVWVLIFAKIQGYVSIDSHCAPAQSITHMSDISRGHSLRKFVTANPMF